MNARTVHTGKKVTYFYSKRGIPLFLKAGNKETFKMLVRGHLWMGRLEAVQQLNATSSCRSPSLGRLVCKLSASSGAQSKGNAGRALVPAFTPAKHLRNQERLIDAPPPDHAKTHPNTTTIVISSNSRCTWPFSVKQKQKKLDHCLRSFQSKFRGRRSALGQL